ncbi:MAG: hypothetical protein R6U58_08285 [Bacteroidales bacterium]
MDLQVNSFEDQLKQDLEKRDARAQKLETLLKNESDPIEIAEAALDVIFVEQDLILALSNELGEEREKPNRYQRQLDENLVAQIRHWKQQFTWLEQRFQQYQQTHF